MGNLLVTMKRDLTRSIRSYLLLIISSILTIFAMVLIAVSSGLSRDFILYYGSALIQSFAALIALPFTIAVIHLQSKYGPIAIKAIFVQIRKVLVIFSIQVITVYALMSQADAVGQLSMSICLHLLVYLLYALITLIPLQLIIRVIWKVFTIKPSDILDSFVKGLDTLVSSDKDLDGLLESAFHMLSICIHELSLRVDLKNVAEKISIILHKIAEKIDSLDLNVSYEEKHNMLQLIGKISRLCEANLVSYLTSSSHILPLPSYEPISKVLVGFAYLVRRFFEKSILGSERAYYNFALILKKILSVYMEHGRIEDAIRIYEEALKQVLNAEDAVLSVKKVQSSIIERPKNYECIFRRYDFYIDYAMSVVYTFFEVVQEKGTSVAVDELWRILMIILEYPVLLVGYYVKSKADDRSDPIIDVIFRQENELLVNMLSIIIAWLARGYALARDHLIDDDRRLLENNVRYYVSSIRKVILRKGIREARIIAYRNHSAISDVKLFLNNRSSSISNLFFKHDMLRPAIEKYDMKSLCSLLEDTDLGFGKPCL